MLVYNTRAGVVIADHSNGPFYQCEFGQWDDLFAGKSSRIAILEQAHQADGQSAEVFDRHALLPPLVSQEVWAAGVTYLRSRSARMEESARAGVSSVYDMVYDAHRPELFLKATPYRVVGSGQAMSLRSDSTWMVPEPELTLAFDATGQFFGYTIGNDLSIRDIEGQNPLYLPQAKVFNRCAALGPGLLLADSVPGSETKIAMAIERGGQTVFSDFVMIGQMKQTFENLCDHLFRDNSFPNGCYLMTGTGIVPPYDFSLQHGDRVIIVIDAIGSLQNTIK